MRIVPYIGEVLHRREVGASVCQTVREMGTDRKTLGWYGEAIPVAGIGESTEVDDSALRCLCRRCTGGERSSRRRVAGAAVAVSG